MCRRVTCHPYATEIEVVVIREDAGTRHRRDDGQPDRPRKMSDVAPVCGPEHARAHHENGPLRVLDTAEEPDHFPGVRDHGLRKVA